MRLTLGLTCYVALLVSWLGAKHGWPRDKKSLI